MYENLLSNIEWFHLTTCWATENVRYTVQYSKRQVSQWRWGWTYSYIRLLAFTQMSNLHILKSFFKTPPGGINPKSLQQAAGNILYLFSIAITTLQYIHSYSLSVSRLPLYDPGYSCSQKRSTSGFWSCVWASRKAAQSTASTVRLPTVEGGASTRMKSMSSTVNSAMKPTAFSAG